MVLNPPLFKAGRLLQDYQDWCCVCCKDKVSKPFDVEMKRGKNCFSCWCLLNVWMLHTCTILNILIQYYWTGMNSPNSYWFSLGRSLFNIFNFDKSAHLNINFKLKIKVPKSKNEDQCFTPTFVLSDYHLWMRFKTTFNLCFWGHFWPFFFQHGLTK